VSLAIFFGFQYKCLAGLKSQSGHFFVKNTPYIALLGCKQPLGVICGPERHLFETDVYLKMSPVSEQRSRHWSDHLALLIVLVKFFLQQNQTASPGAVPCSRPSSPAFLSYLQFMVQGYLSVKGVATVNQKSELKVVVVWVKVDMDYAVSKGRCF